MTTTVATPRRARRRLRLANGAARLRLHDSPFGAIAELPQSLLAFAFFTIWQQRLDLSA